MREKLKVLVVDDEEDIRWQLMRAFFQKNALCECAENGEKGLKLVERTHYDIVLTDLRMPQVHGHKFASKILEAKNAPMVVVITGVTDGNIIHDLILKGVEDIIFKPFNVISNVEKIIAIYNRFRDRRDKSQT